MAPLSTASAETLYVSDELTVPLRSGASMQHRIVNFLPSGAALEALETSADGDYLHVKADDKEGWVKADQLMKSPSARAQLVSLNKRIDNLKADVKQGAGTIAELNARIKQLEEEQRTLEKNRDGLAGSLNELKQVAARPAAIAQQNKQLEDKLASISTEFAAVQSENQQLRDSSLKEWFVIGGAVALVSLLLGLIIPSIKWRKRDSWGGGF